MAARRPPDRRFGSVHVDLVGPLPESNGHSYLFTIVDRHTRWAEAIPMPDASAKSCVSAFMHGFVRPHGIPDDFTSDRGAVFTGQLWRDLGAINRWLY